MKTEEIVQLVQSKQPDPSITPKPSQNSLISSLKSNLKLIFLGIFLLINIIFLFFNLKTNNTNKKILKDNITLYELSEVSNISRSYLSKRVDFLESIIENNNIYLNKLYYMDIVEETYDEYAEDIEEFKQTDLNAIFDNYLELDYNKILYEKRIKE